LHYVQAVESGVVLGLTVVYRQPF